jgi:hypothetical protein
MRMAEMRNGLSTRVARLEAQRSALPDAEPSVRELPLEAWWQEVLWLIDTSEYRQAILATLGLPLEALHDFLKDYDETSAQHFTG